MTRAASTTADTTTRTIIMDTIRLPRRDTKATIRDPKAISKRDIRIRALRMYITRKSLDRTRNSTMTATTSPTTATTMGLIPSSKATKVAVSVAAALRLVFKTSLSDPSFL
ncbi:hypothetical protein FHG87_025076 [Trinorchestia longiramus]|nr:hypothetical protein FHG87_025076 [Trinorchestia longiramus]